ncbi:MAG TPA: sensor histidine kinase [Chroococcidiopsis sp.]
MSSLTSAPTFLPRTLRYAEWVLLLMLLLIYAIDQFFFQVQQLPDLLPQATVFIAIFFALSLIFPSDRPLWQRRCYIAVEIGLILVAQLFWVNFDVLLYFFLMKSCFLLSRREVIITVVCAGLGYLLCNLWTVEAIAAASLAAIRANNLEDMYKPHAIVLGSMVAYVGISLFVVLLGFVIKAERQSRQKAEALSAEIEIMAAALERSRIARDIHDSLGHALTTLNVQLELVQAMGQRDPSQAAQALRNAQQLANQCLEAVRQAVQAVRQEEFDFTHALHSLIAQIRQNHAYTVDQEIHLPPLPMQISHQLYCVIQEGFTNIQKHAQATQIRLLGQVSANAVILELEDNGQGFDPSHDFDGYGLRGMHERVHLLGGKLEITSVVGRGTHIRVVVPL